MGISFNYNDKPLRELQKKIKELDGEKQVPLPELLTDDFLKAHSDFQSLNEMRDTYFVEAIKNKGNEFTAFLTAHTKFSTLDDMLKEATISYTKRKLSF